MADPRPSTPKLTEMVPEHFRHIRQILFDDSFGGRTLLLMLLDRIQSGDCHISELGLIKGLAEEERVFIQKLEVITALAVVMNARGGHYALDEQVEDFLLFARPVDVCRFQNMERFSRAALPTILWAIAEDDRLRARGESFQKFSLPLDIMVAIGSEVADWHLLATEEAGSHGKRIDEALIRGTLASTLRDTYRQIGDFAQGMSLQWAVDEIRRRLGISSVTLAVVPVD